jgi:hypothetical protein
MLIVCVKNLFCAEMMKVWNEILLFCAKILKVWNETLAESLE